MCSEVSRWFIGLYLENSELFQPNPIFKTTENIAESYIKPQLNAVKICPHNAYQCHTVVESSYVEQNSDICFTAMHRARPCVPREKRRL
jgi:hypothetical protein